MHGGVIGRLVHAGDLIVVEVRLVHDTVGGGDPAAAGNASPEDCCAFKLSPHGFPVYSATPYLPACGEQALAAGLLALAQLSASLRGSSSPFRLLSAPHRHVRTHTTTTLTSSLEVAKSLLTSVRPSLGYGLEEIMDAGDCFLTQRNTTRSGHQSAALVPDAAGLALSPQMFEMSLLVLSLSIAVASSVMIEHARMNIAIGVAER